MTKIIRSFTGSVVVDMEIDPFDMESKEFEPAEFVDLVNEWAQESGIACPTFKELCRFWQEFGFGQEEATQQEAVEAEDKAYYDALYRQTAE